MSPPEVLRPPANGRRAPAATGGVRDLWAAASRHTLPRRYWSETWVAAETLLAQLTARLERVREVRTVEIDDGWQADRDIAVGLNRWARLHVRALVEEHRDGRCLVRLARRLRATPRLWLLGACIAGAALAGAAAGPAPYWPWIAGAGAALAAWAARTVRQSARAVAAVDAAVADTAEALELMRLPDAPSPEGTRESAEPVPETGAAPAPASNATPAAPNQPAGSPRRPAAQTPGPSTA